MGYAILFLAIVTEVFSTAALKASQQFTKPVPTVIVVLGYFTCFYLLTQVLKYLPLGLTYAFWAGFGIVLVTLVDIFYYKQSFDVWALVGIGFIVTGVVLIHLFSNSAC